MSNANPYYVDSGLDDHGRFIQMWAPTCGAEEAERSWQLKQSGELRGTSAMVMGDIAPYVSQIDGSVIESRSKHRAHLKAHGCIEIGNETKYLKPAEMKAPGGLKADIIEQFQRRNM